MFADHRDAVIAILTFGDKRHTAFQPYNIETGANSQGKYPRPADQLAGLSAFGSVYHDYCVITDPLCALGNVAATHLNYFDIFSDDAATWVISQVSSGAEPSSMLESPSGVSSSKATATSTTQHITSSQSKTNTIATYTESDSSKPTSSPVVPSATEPASGAAAATSSNPNSAVSSPRGCALGVIGLIAGALLALL